MGIQVSSRRNASPQSVETPTSPDTKPDAAEEQQKLKTELSSSLQDLSKIANDIAIMQYKCMSSAVIAHNLQNEYLDAKENLASLEQSKSDVECMKIGMQNIEILRRFGKSLEKALEKQT